MDALDVRILRVMAFRPFEHAPKHPDVLRSTHVARVVGTTRDTVRSRVQRMEEDGVIVGYHAVPNLQHFGLTAGGYYFRVPDGDRKDEAVKRVLDVDHVLEVHDFLGGGLCVDFAFRDDAGVARTVSELRDATGVPGDRFYEHALPDVPRALTPLDWRIVHAVRKRPLGTPADFADALGVTARTVRRRLDRLVRESSLFVAPRIDPSRAAGLLVVEMLFFLRRENDTDAMRAITQEFDAHNLFGYVPATRELGNFNLLAVARSPAEVDALRRRGCAIPGVDAVEAWPFRRFVGADSWLDAAIAERAA